MELLKAVPLPSRDSRRRVKEGAELHKHMLRPNVAHKHQLAVISH